MDFITTTLSIILLAFVLQTWRKKVKSKKLPPGPKGLPLFGSLHLLGKLPHRDLCKLAQKYGSIMYMRLGLVPTVVISSHEAAKLVLKTHDNVFASRPSHECSKYMVYNQKNFVFAPYGPYWRNIRKMCTFELLSSAKMNSFMSMRKEELDLLIQYLMEASLERTIVDIRAKVSSLNADMTCRMVFGKKYMNEEFDERGFKAVIQEGLRLAAVNNIGDYIPWLAPLDLQGLRKQFKAVSKVFDAFLEKIIEEHIESKNPNQTKDFVDVMINIMGSKETEYHIGRDNIKAIIMDILVAATDTSSIAIEWALSELLKHPRIMKKVQKELEEKVDMNRMVEESDLESLEYLDMVIKETFRLHSVGPLLVPHESMEDCTVNGFFIPKKTRIIVNAYAIGRDPTVWNDADKFLPERFIGSGVDIRGQHFQLLPFGSGRRRCPGMELGITVVKLVLAQLLHCFDWELPDGMSPTDLDMEEEFGLSAPRANHLIAAPTYRLNL